MIKNYYRVYDDKGASYFMDPNYTHDEYKGLHQWLETHTLVRAYRFNRLTKEWDECLVF